MTKVTRIISIILLIIIQFTSSASIASHQVSCKNDICQVQLRLLSDNEVEETYTVELIKETRGIFSENGKVITNFKTMETKSIKEIQRFSQKGSRYHTKKNDPLHATAWIQNEETIKDGVFFTPNHGIIEVHSSNRRLRGNKPHEKIMVGDVVKDLPEGRFWKTTSTKKSLPLPLQKINNSRRILQDADELPPNEVIGSVTYIVPFFPGCYPTDQLTHQVTVNLIVDYGLYLDLTVGISDPNDAQAAVLDEVTYQFSVGQLIYYAQLNVHVVVNQILFGTESDPAPLSQSNQHGTCMMAPTAQDQLAQWNSANYQNFGAGYILLLSDCFVGITGTSYTGGICQTIDNVGVSAFDWSVMFHELGHGFGASHTFENGVGTTGGLMDYGDPLYNGAAQFNYNSQNPGEVCSFLSYWVDQGTCPYITILSQSSSCGDGILSGDEECECLVPSSAACSASACVNCILNNANIKCSSATFIMRMPSTPSIQVVDATALSDLTCCPSTGVFAPPKTICGGGLNVCSAEGECVGVCSNVLGSTAQNCGFNSNGCQLGCIYNDKCYFTFTYELDDGSTRMLSSLPDGAPCYMANNKVGVCSTTGLVTECLATLPISYSPTSAPTTSRAPTVYVPESPTISDTITINLTPTPTSIQPTETSNPTKTPSVASTNTPTFTSHPSNPPSNSPAKSCAGWKFNKPKCEADSGCYYCKKKGCQQTSCRP